MADLLVGCAERSGGAGFGFAPARAPMLPEPLRPLTDASEAHCLLIAPTGTGKGRSVLIPNLLHWSAPVIVVDIKGEAAATTARYRRERLDQQIVFLDPFGLVSDGSGGLNPLDWLAASQENLADNVMMLTQALTGGLRSAREPFWDDAADSLIEGLLVAAATHPDPTQRHVGTVWDILSDSDDGTTLRIERLVHEAQWLDRFARQQLNNFQEHDYQHVRPSVLSTAQQHLRLFASPLVQRSLSRTTFDLRLVEKGAPLTIYLVIPPSKLASHAAMLRMWLAVLLGSITERTQRPPEPTLFMVDELAAIGAFPLFVQAITLLRGYGVRALLVFQSLSQLQTLWPTDYRTIIENCGLFLTFGHSRIVQSEQIAALLGDISDRELFALRPNQLSVSRAGARTQIVRKLDYLQDVFFRGRADPNPYFRTDAGSRGGR